MNTDILLTNFKESVLPYEDELCDEDWRSITLGWALAKGMSYTEAEDFFRIASEAGLT